jgi:hypothetical protein
LRLTPPIRPSLRVSRASLRQAIEAPTILFLILLVLADLAFCGLHLAYSPDGLMDDARFRLDWDRGYAETLQYVKEFWIVLLLLYLALRERAFLYLVFAGFFGYLGLDDAGRLHERIGGGVIGSSVPDLTLFGRTLAGYDLGQTLYALALGLSFFGLVTLLYRGSRAAVKRTAHTLLLLVALATFGVSTDILNAFVSGDALEAFFVFAEEGGEHLVVTTILGYLFIMAGVGAGERRGDGKLGVERGVE